MDLISSVDVAVGTLAGPVAPAPVPAANNAAAGNKPLGAPPRVCGNTMGGGIT